MGFNAESCGTEDNTADKNVKRVCEVTGTSIFWIWKKVYGEEIKEKKQLAGEKQRVQSVSPNADLCVLQKNYKKHKILKISGLHTHPRQAHGDQILVNLANLDSQI